MISREFSKSISALVPRADYLASGYLLPLVAERDRLIFLEALRLGVTLWDCFGFTAAYREAELRYQQATQALGDRVYTIGQFYREVSPN